MAPSGLTDLGQQPRDLALQKNMLSTEFPFVTLCLSLFTAFGFQAHCKDELCVSTVFTCLSQENELGCLPLLYK